MSTIFAFLLGIVVMAAATAGTFFLKFWRSTRDILFGAFAAFFFLEAAERVAQLLSPHPNQAGPWIHVIRLLGLLFILAAILGKNFRIRGS